METEWRYERRCFEDVINHLGVCYAQLPSTKLFRIISRGRREGHTDVKGVCRPPD